MTKRKNLLASVSALSLIFTTPVLADEQSTKILEEYFDFFKSTPMSLAVGDKEDKARYTQWNNVTLKSDDGTAQFAIPWIKVSKKLLGRYQLTFSESIGGLFQSPDPEILNPVKFALESKDMVVDISGKEGARKYNSSFEEVTFRTQDSDLISMSAKMTGGTGFQLMESGDMGKSSGNFSVKDMVVEYSLDIDGQAMSSRTSIQGFSGDFEIPLYDEFDPENPTSFFDPSRNFLIAYGTGSGSSKVSVETPVGPMNIDATFDAGTGSLGVLNSVATVQGTTKDITYDVTALAMGLPPMQLSLSEAVVDIKVPLDNVEESQPAIYKVALSKLQLSDQVWAMFDPKGLLPRDEIDLDIDLLANMRWLKKIADIDVGTMEQTPPVVVESAQIKAFNLKIAGAELLTTGSVLIDNSQFPPVPDGTVNIALNGAQGLLGKLTEIGILPAQNAMFIQGMSAMFFKPSGDGDDRLVSTIKMGKDGSITANGMPLK
jgi:hypothetical protein